MSEWQSIETAELNSLQHVLVYGDEIDWDGEKLPGEEVFIAWGGEDDGVWSIAHSDAGRCRPTHWQHLPAAPLNTEEAP